MNLSWGEMTSVTMTLSLTPTEKLELISRMFMIITMFQNKVSHTFSYQRLFFIIRSHTLSPFKDVFLITSFTASILSSTARRVLNWNWIEANPIWHCLIPSNLSAYEDMSTDENVACREGMWNGMLIVAWGDVTGQPADHYTMLREAAHTNTTHHR